MKKKFRELFAEAEKDPAYWTERAVLRATEEIFRAMEREKVSRAELARRLGTSPAYVTKVLRGNVNFTLATLARIAHALEGEFEVHLSPREMRTRRLDSPTDAERPAEAFKTMATLRRSTPTRAQAGKPGTTKPGTAPISRRHGG